MNSAALLAGEEAAWRRLHDETLPVLWAYVRRRASSAERTREIVAEVWLGLVAGIARFDPSKGELMAFILGIARNRLAVERRLAPRRAMAPLEAGAEVPVPDPDDHSERLAILDAALAGLPATEQDLIRWHHLDHLPLAAIGERLGTTTKAAERRLARAREQLRTRFQRLWEQT